MTSDQLKKLLEAVAHSRIAVIGDYCLDIYWIVDMSRSEASIETGACTHPVSEQRYSLGGAGNVVSNLLATGCRAIRAFTVVGNDPWGKELVRILDSSGVDTSGIVMQTEGWSTLAYTKPYVGDSELNRLDFGNFNAISEASAMDLIGRLEIAIAEVDVVVINQQVIEGIHSDGFRASLRQVIARHPDTIFIADSRHFSDAYTGACLKLNDHEAARLTGVDRAPAEMVLREETLQSAEEIFQEAQRPVFISRGARGVVVRDARGVVEIPGIQVLGKTDTVGAGDSLLAGIASGLAAGADPCEAAELGSYVATVTIQKLRQTGTATPSEVVAIGESPDFVYLPELADDPRNARMLKGTEFEMVRSLPEDLRITHAIFDHDGTISTLRQGWEEIMEPMMVRAILGPKFETADESLYHTVVDRSRDYIDKSTGIQTLVQMQGLVQLVREFGCVPDDQILDENGYKTIYNDALLEMVNGRVRKLRAGELSIEDFTIKNAPLLLERLASAGVKLYLASGTDEADVKSEAEALGYSDLFEGRIYGAVGDVTKEAKRIVLDRILNDVADQRGLVTFGDGPVEMRETRKRGGLAVGIASDEVRRYGSNSSKRARLIRSGADMIVPDFSQLDRLLEVLNIETVDKQTATTV